MHVVFAVHDAASQGAVMSVTQRQAEFLAREGDRVTLVSNRMPILSWKGVEVIRDPCPRHVGRGARLGSRLVSYSGRLKFPRGWPLMDFGRVVEQLDTLRLIERVLPDIHSRGAIHVCICCQHTMAQALDRFRRITGVGFALVSHGDVFSHPLTAFSLPLRSFYRRAAVHAYRKADKVYSVSRDLEKVALARGCRIDRSFYIPNGIDPEEIGWPPVRSVVRGRAFRLLCVGRLSPEKGHEHAVAALQWLQDIDVELILVGEGPCGARLRDMAARLQVMDRCVFVGSVARTELGAHYACADIFLQPSLSEGMPLTVLEAMMCGVPVVASKVGGIPDLVTQGVEGVLVPPGSARHLADAVRSLLGKRERLDTMKLRAAEAGMKQRWDPLLSVWRADLASAFTPAFV